MAGLAIITEACVDTKDRACPRRLPRAVCIYEFNPSTNQLFSEAEAGSGDIANTHTPAPDAIGIVGDSVLYVNLDECTSCTACYQTDVCPLGAIYADEYVPDGSPNAKYNRAGRNGGNSRNGHRPKTVITDIGPVPLEVPRDRDGSFEPRLVRKRQRRLAGVDELVISLTAKGFDHR